MQIEIFTDGSCLGNPGPGGWAALIKREGQIDRLQGGEAHTTNNRMELLAVIQAFKAVLEDPTTPQAIHLWSDSSWVLNTITKGWKRKKNLDLWAQLDPLLAQLRRKDVRLEFNWVKGHSGHPENEDCDQRALAEAQIWATMPKLNSHEGPPTLF